MEDLKKKWERIIDRMFPIVVREFVERAWLEERFGHIPSIRFTVTAVAVWQPPNPAIEALKEAYRGNDPETR